MNRSLRLVVGVTPPAEPGQSAAMATRRPRIGIVPPGPQPAALTSTHTPADTAARKLMDALNPARAERLKPSQVLLVLRLAHEAGYHATAQWLMGECGYAVQVVEPVAQVDRAMAAVEFAAKALTDATAMLERAQRMRVAA